MARARARRIQAQGGLSCGLRAGGARSGGGAFGWGGAHLQLPARDEDEEAEGVEVDLQVVLLAAKVSSISSSVSGTDIVNARIISAK